MERVRDLPGSASTALPGSLSGDWWRWLRTVACAFCLPTLLILWYALGAGAPARSGKVERIDAAGAVVRKLPVARIDNIVVDKHKNGADVIADYTVWLPAPGDGKGAPATFRTRTKHRIDPGEKIHVLYAPTAPQLGAVGDDWAGELDRMVAGRTFGIADQRFVLIVWALFGGAGMLAPALLIPAPAGRRRMGEGGLALRAVVVGDMEHIEVQHAVKGDQRSDGGTKSATRQQCLALRTAIGDIPFSHDGMPEQFAPVVLGTQGWLHWEPSRRTSLAGRKLRMVKADLVSDDGWHLRGEIPVEESDKAATRAQATPAGDPARQVHSLDLTAAWALTLGRTTVGSLLVALLCAASLLLRVDGTWRIWVAIAGAVATLVALISHLVHRYGDQETAEQTS